MTRKKVEIKPRFADWPIIPYASWMGTPKLHPSLNQMVSNREGVRLLFEPNQAKFGCAWRRPPLPDDDGWWPYCLDNGRWSARHDISTWNEWEFWHMVARMAEFSDFLAIPDLPPPIDDDDESSVPADHGARSFKESCLWLERLVGCPVDVLLFVVQDQMKPSEVKSLLESNPGLGLFIGGTTPWKLRTASVWGQMCNQLGRHCHMGRVNSAKRARIAYDAGCHSIDGTGLGTLFACNVRRIMDSIRGIDTEPKIHTDLPLFELHGVIDD